MSKIQKEMAQLIKDAQISEKKYQNIHNLPDKTGCKNYCNYKVNASKSFSTDNHKTHQSQ